MDKKKNPKEVGVAEILEALIKTRKEEAETEEILERKITQFGNTCHVTLPKKHEGKQARILIKKEVEEKDNK